MSAALSHEAAAGSWRRHLGSTWRDSVPAELARGSLPEAFAAAAAANGDRPALTIGDITVEPRRAR